MIPIILHTSSTEKTEEFLKTFVKDNAIKPQNITHLVPEGKEFSIKLIRELIKQNIYSATEKSVYVLHAFDSASPEAQNAFLKTLEEHKDTDQFIMEVTQPYKLLPTILSRSNRINLTAQSKIATNLAEIEEIFKSGTPPFNHPFFQMQKYEDPTEPFDKLIEYVRSRLGNANNTSSVLKELIIARNRVRENNLNPQYALDRVLIFIYKNSTDN